MNDKFKRLYEIKSILPENNINKSIFRDFENSCIVIPEKLTSFLAWEKELQQIERSSWEDLKMEAKHKYHLDQNGRGYEQFFNILNQAKAYNFLKNDGCSIVNFIKRTNQKTPDIEAWLNKEKILCEVKTINPSDKEIIDRQQLKAIGFVAHDTHQYLDDGFFRRLKSTLTKAAKQLNTYDDQNYTRKLIFIVINFDDSFSEYKENFYSQIDEYIFLNPVNGIEIVFYNQKTVFHKIIVMKYARVVNQM